MIQRTLRLFALLAAAALFTGAAQSGMTIWSPRQVNAAFVEAGQTFVAEVQAASSASTTGWTVSLQNDLRTWPATFVSAAWGRIKHNTRDGWRLTIRVPAGTPPELFRLNLAHTALGSASVTHAVSVVDELESNFYVLQLTDEHVRTLDAPRDDGYRSAELVGWASPVVNLVNPRFVLNSGDDTDSMAWADSPNQFPWYKQARSGYRVPCVTIPGNHDVAATGSSRHAVSTNRWDAEMGYRTFSRRMGSFYVLAHDFHDSALRTWAANEWSQSFTDTTIKYRLLTQHFTGANSYLPPSGKYPNLMLLGHLHSNLVSQTTPYPILVNTAALSNARAGFHEFRKTSTGWTNTSATGHEGGSNQVSLVGAWGAPRVRVAYAKANDGTQSSNTATITNDLAKTFYDGRVRFLLPAGSYTLTGAQKLAEYTYSGGTKTAVLARVSLLRSAVTKVSIAPSSSTTTVTRTFQDGVTPSSTYAGTRDTVLSQNQPTTNFAAAATLLVDGSDPHGSDRDLSTLIKWDVSSIPLGSAITSARITLNVVNVSPLTYEAYAMKRPWSETQATWNQWATGSAWELPGAKGPLDRGSTVLGTLTGATTGTHTVTLNAAGLTLLQGWVNAPSSNQGLILADPVNTDGADFSSSEAATPSLRPKLTVTYTTSSAAVALWTPLEETAETEEPIDVGDELGVSFDDPPAASDSGGSGGPMRCGATGLECVIVMGAILAFRRWRKRTCR